MQRGIVAKLGILFLFSYSVLNIIRAPYNNVYDPGIDKIGENAEAVQAEQITACDVLTKPPSAPEFLTYVRRNRPFVLRGGALSWPATKTWTLDYLMSYMGETQVSPFNSNF